MRGVWIASAPLKNGGFLARGDQERAWNLANTLLTWIVAGFAVVALLVSLLAEPLISVVIAPELPAESQELAVNLTRLLLLSPLLLGLSAAGKGMLEAQSAFMLPAIAPILYTVGIIAGALLLTPVMGIYGLAAGVISAPFPTLRSSSDRSCAVISGYARRFRHAPKALARLAT